MASRDLKPDGSDLPRSLSEQLRILEQQLSRLSDGAPVGLLHPQPQRLPTSLGRPIGLAPPVLTVPPRDDDEDDTAALASRERRTFRRRVVIASCSLLLLTASAIVPALLRHPSHPEMSVAAPPPAVVVMRTEQFAEAARELGNARVSEPAPVEVAPSAPAPVAAPPPPGQVLPPARPTTTLTVPESELPRLGLPMLVSGGGPSWAGSAVVIDGLPTEARVSHGMKIAPDTWTVGIADVGHAVLSLPRSTPDQLELSVRVVAADSHELAASALRIHVVRSPERPAMIAPAAVFEPAAAETGAGPEIDPAQASRQAVKVERPKRPASPAKPPVTQQAKQPDRPTATSAWVSELRPAAPQLGFSPMPSWAPFNR